MYLHLVRSDNCADPAVGKNHLGFELQRRKGVVIKFIPPRANTATWVFGRQSFVVAKVCLSFPHVLTRLTAVCSRRMERSPLNSGRSKSGLFE